MVNIAASNFQATAGCHFLRFAINIKIQNKRGGGNFKEFSISSETDLICENLCWTCNIFLNQLSQN